MENNNSIISESAVIGNNVKIMYNCVIEDGVIIGDNSYIDSNTIIRRGTVIGDNAFVGANCILGEYSMDFCVTRMSGDYTLKIGANALIRSGSIIYTDSQIGDNFQTGHRVTIREKTTMGNNVSVGTLSDIQGNCNIGNYVRMHSNVHIGQLSEIEDYVWIFPYVVLTNDPTPPSSELVGVHVESFAIITTGAIVMPGVVVRGDSLVGAGSIVTKTVDRYSVVVGNPARHIADIRNVKNKITGEPAYPWREHFGRGMPWEKDGYEEWIKSLDVELNSK